MRTSVTEPMERLAVSFEEAAKLLPLSIYTLRLYERRGMIKSCRVGRRVMIPMAEIKRIATEGVRSQSRSSSD
jgi:predicted site-specific integrase-resolvase